MTRTTATDLNVVNQYPPSELFIMELIHLGGICEKHNELMVVEKVAYEAGYQKPYCLSCWRATRPTFESSETKVDDFGTTFEQYQEGFRKGVDRWSATNGLKQG